MNELDEKNNKKEIKEGKDKEKEKNKDKEKEKKNNNDEIITKNMKKNVPHDSENVPEVVLEIDVDVIINLLFKTYYRGKNLFLCCLYLFFYFCFKFFVIRYLQTTFYLFLLSFTCLILLFK